MPSGSSDPIGTLKDSTCCYSMCAHSAIKTGFRIPQSSWISSLTGKRTRRRGPPSPEALLMPATYLPLADPVE
eukprot:1801647-Pyramimonas_sp.AAC.1